jgi:hypothetical protein
MGCYWPTVGYWQARRQVCRCVRIDCWAWWRSRINCDRNHVYTRSSRYPLRAIWVFTCFPSARELGGGSWRYVGFLLSFIAVISRSHGVFACSSLFPRINIFHRLTVHLPIFRITLGRGYIRRTNRCAPAIPTRTRGCGDSGQGVP